MQATCHIPENTKNAFKLIGFEYLKKIVNGSGGVSLVKSLISVWLFPQIGGLGEKSGSCQVIRAKDTEGRGAWLRCDYAAS